MVPLKGVSNNSDEPEISGAVVRFRSQLLAHREATNARLEQMETSLRTAMATLLEDFQASLMEGLNSLVAGRNSTRRAPETAPPDGAVRFGSVTSPVLAHKDASSTHARSEGPPLLQLNSGGNSSAHSYSKSNPGVHLPCVGLDSMNMCIDASLGVRTEVMGVKKDKMQAGDVDVGSSVDFVQGRFAGGDYGGVQPLFGQMVAECHALKVFDEMPKSKGLSSVEKSFTRIRDKGGGLAHQPKSSETYSAQEDKNANRSVEKNDQIDDGHAMLKVELTTLFIERDDVLAHKKTGVVDGVGIGESHVNENGQILADKVEVQKQLETEAVNCHDFYKSGDESFIIHDHEESISERIDTKHLGNTPVGNRLCEKGEVLAAFDEVHKQLGTPFLSGPIPDQSEVDLSGVHSYQKSISEPDLDDTTAGIGSSCKAYGCDNVPSERSFSIVADGDVNSGKDDQVDYVKYFTVKGQLEPKRQKCSPMFTWISENMESFNQEDPQHKNKLAELRATNRDIRSSVDSTSLGLLATPVDVNIGLLKGKCGKENVCVDDDYENMHGSFKRELGLLLEKWKSLMIVETESKANIVQWLTFCWNPCNCQRKGIVLFCKEVFDGNDEMFQTSLFQVHILGILLDWNVMHGALKDVTTNFRIDDRPNKLIALNLAFRICVTHSLMGQRGSADSWSSVLNNYDMMILKGMWGRKAAAGNGRDDDVDLCCERVGLGDSYDEHTLTILPLCSGYVSVGKSSGILMLWYEVKGNISVYVGKRLKYHHNMVSAFLYVLVKGGRQPPLLLPYVIVFVMGEVFTRLKLLPHGRQINQVDNKAFASVIFQLHSNEPAVLIRSNGMRVCYKGTNFLGDQIMFAGFSYWDYLELVASEFSSGGTGPTDSREIVVYGHIPSVLMDMLAHCGYDELRYSSLSAILAVTTLLFVTLVQCVTAVHVLMAFERAHVDHCAGKEKEKLLTLLLTYEVSDAGRGQLSLLDLLMKFWDYHAGVKPKSTHERLNLAWTSYDLAYPCNDVLGNGSELVYIRETKGYGAVIASLHLEFFRCVAVLEYKSCVTECVARDSLILRPEFVAITWHLVQGVKKDLKTGLIAVSCKDMECSNLAPITTESSYFFNTAEVLMITAGREVACKVLFGLLFYRMIAPILVDGKMSPSLQHSSLEGLPIPCGYLLTAMPTYLSCAARSAILLET